MIGQQSNVAWLPLPLLDNLNSRFAPDHSRAGEGLDDRVASRPTGTPVYRDIGDPRSLN